MEQETYWALLGHTEPNGMVGNLQVIKVIETTSEKSMPFLDYNETFYRSWNNDENIIEGCSVPEIIEKLQNIIDDIKKRGIKFIKPGEAHTINIEKLERIQKKIDEPYREKN